MEVNQYPLNFLYFVNLHERELRVEISTIIDKLFLAYVVEPENLRQTGEYERDTDVGGGRAEE